MNIYQIYGSSTKKKNISKPTNMGSKQQKWAGYSEDIKWRMGLHAKLV